jgi:uncharacterized repeat protein (TIGR04138 family)
MLCERRQKRDATVFLTTSIEEVVTPRNLCPECFEIDQPETARMTAEHESAGGWSICQAGPSAQMLAELEAGCRYCGKKCGATFCRRCLEEFQRVMELKGVDSNAGEWTAEQRTSMLKAMQEVEEHMKKWVAERGPDDSDDPEGPSWSVDAIYGQLAASDSRFKVEAYRFVREAVLSAIEKASAGEAVHVSGGDVCEAFRALAILRYRKGALPTLQGWGIHSTDDIGAVVYRMIEARILGAQPEDKLEDFHALYDFAAAFPVA